MSARELSEQLRARGLPVAAQLLASAQAAPLFDATRLPLDPRLVEPPATQLKALLAQMARRGTDPRLVEALWPSLQGRPLERALVAWDTLASSVLAPDDRFGDELRAASQPLRPVLPAAARFGIDLNHHPSTTLVADFGGSAAPVPTGVEELVAAFGFSLATLERLRAAGDPMMRAPAVLGSIAAFAKLLQLAHLPTLASVYFDYLAGALGERPCALELCETLFDAEAAPFIPGDAVRPGDAPPDELTDLGETLLYRSYLAVGHAAEAHRLLEENLARRARALGPPSPRLTVVRAHLGTLAGSCPVAFDVVDRIVAAAPLWRYGARARLVTAAAQSAPSSKQPLQLWYDYIGGFGNDFRPWYESLSVAPPSAAWRRDSCAVLAREALHLPHDRGLWQAIFMTLGGSDEVARATRELQARLVQQTA
ncbi:MAG: hypothetical protein JWN44_2042 [Myxococcales bacterium]|nr:hypothetical protein [Myxococcales bacterium]